MQKPPIVDLPPELQVNIAQNLTPDEVQTLCEAYPEINYLCEWDYRAEQEFKFPRQAFPFVGDIEKEKTPVQTYIMIRDMIPTRKNMDNLYLMVKQWDFNKNRFSDTYTLDWLMDPRPTGPAMTEAEANQYLDEMEDLSETDFTPANHLYLTSKYTYSYYPKGRGYESVKIEMNPKTLVRGSHDDGILYREILEQTRSLFPTGVSGWVNEYRFKGFSDEGYPILRVNLEF